MLWVGQFGIVEGEARGESPGIGVCPESGRPDKSGEESSDLFVIVEPALEGREEYCRDLSQVIGKQFRERRLSLTGGILRALKGAHESLRDWNRRSLKQHRVAAGVSCLALRGGAPAWNTYLGQVAPAAAAVLHGGSLERLGARPPRAGPPPSTAPGTEPPGAEPPAAVARAGRRLLSSVVSSQVEMHARYGGV